MNALPTQPRLPIPEPLRANELGTFTHSSVVERLPDIGARTLEENDFPDPVAGELQELFDGIPNAPIRPILDPGAPDETDWAGYAAPYLGQNWLDVPWFFAETYFYRRILRATGYFRVDPDESRDPFRRQKSLGLASAAELASSLGANLGRSTSPRQALVESLLASLWGNQADLSLWPVHEGSEAQASHPKAPDNRVLVDDLPLAVDSLISTAGGRRIELIADNAGAELVADLYLALVLILRLHAASVVMRVKAHPTFVSDATQADVVETISALAGSAEADSRTLGHALRACLNSGQLKLAADWYWTSPLSGWDMPGPLWRELGEAPLMIVKGDANYRRFLGDRHWPFTVPIHEILAYAPAPVLFLRTLKSEVAAGLDPLAAERAQASDPNWLTNGEWAMIQLIDQPQPRTRPD